MTEFISFCEQFTIKLINKGKDIVELLTNNLYDSFAPFLPNWVISLLPESVINTLSQYSVIDLMFGAGLVFFVGYTLFKFFKI